MSKATDIYRAVLVECERRRLQLGWPMWELDDRAGGQDGYYPKGLYPDGKSGRQMLWPTLQLYISALFPDGFDLEIRPCRGMGHGPKQAQGKIRSAVALNDKRSQREFMREIGRLGGMAKVPMWKRRAIARKASRAAAKKRREMARKRRLEPTPSEAPLRAMVDKVNLANPAPRPSAPKVRAAALPPAQTLAARRTNSVAPGAG